MQADGPEAEVPEEEREALRVVAGGDEDDGRLARELVEDVGEVAVLVLGGDEEVLLHQGPRGGELARDLHLDGVRQRGALQLGHLGFGWGWVVCLLGATMHGGWMMYV